eukprot:3703152-Amphidinium_carterae.1
MKRTIQERHDVLYENDCRVQKEAVPLGWMYVAPRGHTTSMENQVHYRDSMLSNERLTTSCF